MKELLEALDSGELRDELEIVRALRSPFCSTAFVETLAASPWVLSRQRIVLALVRHPACPRTFAARALPLLGWNDLLAVAADPRAAMPVRQQAQNKLLERLPALTVGEKVSLARKAPPSVILCLLQEEDPRVVGALLDNPKLQESHCVRLAAESSSAKVLGQVLRHNRWGTVPAVRMALLANPSLPPPLAMAMLVSLTDEELEGLERNADYPQTVRRLASQALWVRQLRKPGEPRYLH
ncbi:MAG: hypothetical protein NZ869_02125 [Thermoanaerobaculum sp.]|nr:hypothetical protein [Thermoanaerobaculum sp.]MDW7968329.1 hypothetical protein [Thermoanaerobaculum sp.]